MGVYPLVFSMSAQGLTNEWDAEPTENGSVQLLGNADFADARVRPDLGICGAEAVI